MPTIQLFRPVGQPELDLIAASGWRRFPPRLDWQPIFYPVLTEDYATQIARDWNTKDEANGNVGYVTAFEVDAAYLARQEVHEVGGRDLREYWIRSEELDEFNDHIVGRIGLRSEWRPSSSRADRRRGPDLVRDFAPDPVVVPGGQSSRKTAARPAAQDQSAPLRWLGSSSPHRSWRLVTNLHPAGVTS